MAAPDLDPRSSALDELHALLKSDKISKRKVSCQIIFLWADFCLRERFSLLLLLPIFSECTNRAFNRIQPPEEKGFRY